MEGVHADDAVGGCCKDETRAAPMGWERLLTRGCVGTRHAPRARTARSSDRPMSILPMAMAMVTVVGWLERRWWWRWCGWRRRRRRRWWW